MNIANNFNHPVARATRCCSGVTGAVIAAGVVAAGASAYGASEQASSQNKANKRNERNMRDTNALNYRMFREGRGAGGSALLPLYARRDGKPFERELFADALGIYDATGALSPEERFDQYMELTSQLDPAQAASMGAVNDLFSGALEEKAVANVNPVAQARTQSAEARKNAALESLNQTVNEIKAINARKGFSGDSYGQRLLEFEARRRGNTEASLALADANLANRSEEAGIRNAAIMMRLNNLGLPMSAKRQAIANFDLPADATREAHERRQSVFSGLRIAPGSFRYAPLPMVQPVASTAGIAADGIADTANLFGGYAASKRPAQYPATGPGGQTHYPYSSADGSVYYGGPYG